MNLHRSMQDLQRLLGDPGDPASPASATRSIELDERDEFPQSAIDAVDGWGIGAHFVPKAWGGRFHSAHEALELVRCLARADLTLAIAKAKTMLGCLPVWFGGSDDQKRKLAEIVIGSGDVSLALTERAHGSDLLANETLAVSDPAGGYRLNGEKWLINNGTRSRALCVLARTAPGNGARALSFFLVDKKDLPAGVCHPLPKIRTHGIRGADISGVAFKDCSVPASALIGRLGHGLDLTLKTFQFSRTLCAGLSLGGLEHALGIVAEFASARRLYGDSLWNFPVARHRLVLSLVDLWICDAVATSAARSIHLLPEQMSLLSSVAKVAVPVRAETALRELAVTLGARHYLRDLCDPCNDPQSGAFQKILRDHSLVPLFDGSTQVNLHVVATQLRAFAADRDARGGAAAAVDPTMLRGILDAGVELADFEFTGFRFSNAGLDTWMDALELFAAERSPFASSFARALIAARRQIDREVGVLPAAEQDPLRSPRSFELAERQLGLHSASASLLAWKWAPGFSNGPAEEVRDAFLRVSARRLGGELELSGPFRAADDSYNLAIQTLGQELERRRARRQTYGLVPLERT